MAIPSYRAAGTKGESTTTITPGLPASWAADDIHILPLEASDSTIAAPSGYTLIGTAFANPGGSTSATRLAVYGRRAVGGDAAPTVADPGDHILGQMFGLRGALATGTAWGVLTQFVATSSSDAIPGGNTPVDDCIVVLVASDPYDTGSNYHGAYANSLGKTVTKRYEARTTQGNGGGFAVFTVDMPTAGPVGNFSDGGSTNPNGCAYVVFYVRPPITLPNLSLSRARVNDNASIGDVVGAVVGQTAGSSLSLTDDAGGLFALDGSNIEVADSLTAGTYDIDIQETLSGATNSPKTTTITITVVTPKMAFIGSATGTTTCALPSHQPGDFIRIYAFKDNLSVGAPTLPSGEGWLDEGSSSTTGCAARVASKVADSSSEGVGTFTGATTVIATVHRPISGFELSAGEVALQAGVGTTVTFPALTLDDPAGDSWVQGFAGHRSTNTNLQNAPAGMVNRATVVDGTDEGAAHDSAIGLTSWPSTPLSVGGTSSGWIVAVGEIVATEIPPPAAGYGRTYLIH